MSNLAREILSSQGRYTDNKTYGRKKDAVLQNSMKNQQSGRNNREPIFHNLKEADCRKGNFRREIKLGLCVLPLQQKQDTYRSLNIFLYKRCYKILSKLF